jgi:integrase
MAGWHGVNGAGLLRHALDVLGDRPLNTIRRGDVQALLAGLVLAPGTVRLVRQHLSGVLQAAVDDGLLVRNPARGVKVAASPTGEVVPPTTAQVQALYDAAPEWFRAAIILGAGLGLRQAEASGLTVERIDWLRDRSVRIDRQWQTKVQPFAFAPPKSVASVRTIPAASSVLAELGSHVGPRRDGFVLSTDGRGAVAVSHNQFATAWRTAMKAAGLEGFRYHDLRHYFASSLISAGCSVKAVQHALGHASASVTLDVYGHLWPGDEDRIRAAVDAAFGAAEYSLSTAATI